MPAPTAFYTLSAAVDPDRPEREWQGMDRRPDIDGLRAYAVLAVIMFHAPFAAFGGGYVGVDVFFVISGFLITRLIRQRVDAGTFTLASFYFGRVRRLVPALLTSVLATAFAAYFILSPADLKQFGASAFFSLLGFSNFYFWWGEAETPDISIPRQLQSRCCILGP